MKKHFEHLESLLYLYSFPLLNSHPLSFVYHFVIAQIYALTTCLIPRLPEWKRQMSCFWLAPIHALRHHFSMLEFERGLYSLVVNKHADPSGFVQCSGGAVGSKLRAFIQMVSVDLVHLLVKGMVIYV